MNTASQNNGDFMKLSKSVASQIADAIAHLDRALNFIASDQTRIVRITRCTVFPTDGWTSGTGEAGVAINKEIGSDLCHVANARQKLHRLVTPVTVENSNVTL